MKFIIVFLCFNFLYACHQDIFGQPIQQGYADIGRYSIFKVHPISLGESLPDVEFSVENYTKPRITFNDFANKLVVLDFWETTCSSCIGSFPHMEALQKKFGDKIQVILVNAAQKKGYVESFYHEHPNLKRPSLPMITGDTTLFQYFPHKILPHHVWIYNDIVYSIHANNHTTENTIGEFLAARKINIPQKDDYVLADDSLSSAIKIHEKQGDICSYSILTGERSAGGHKDLIESAIPDSEYPNKITLVDQNFLTLAATAYGERFKKPKYNFLRGKYGHTNNVIFELKDDSSTYPNRHDEKSYCYYSEVPINQDSHIFEMMRDNIQINFPDFDIKVEERVINCLVLSGTPNNRLLTKGKSDCPGCDKEIEFRNVPFSKLADAVSYYIDDNWLVTPFVDATNFKGKIDIKFEKWDSIDLLRSILKKYGLKLEEKPWLTDVLVIHQK